MTPADDEIAFGPFRLDLRRRQLSREGKAVPLGSRAMELLCALAAARGDLVTKDQLMAQAWPGIAVEEHNLYVHISMLRKALEEEEDEQAYLITVPGRGYRFVGAPSRAEPRPGPADGSLASADKPSIAVLPFQNMSGDPEQDYFADGMVEEIIAALSRFRHLFVIARNSSFAYKGRSVDVKQVGRELGVRYLLEGSVRRAAGRVRITGKLIDAANGAHLWGDRFEANLDDVFELQDRVTANVVGAIAPKLEAAEIERARRKPTDRLDAYDCYLRGAPIASSTDKGANDEALRWLYKAVALDPDFALAYAKAAQCHAFRKVNGWTTGRPEEIAEAARVGRLAVTLGRDDAVALAYGGFVLAYVAGQLDDGAAFVDLALALNPNWAYAWAASGWMKLCFGDPDAAVEHTGKAIRLSPFDPLMFAWQSLTALAQICAGRYDEAVAWSAKSLLGQPTYPPALRVAAASNALVGRLDEAREAMRRTLALDPTLSLASLAVMLPPFRRREDRETFVGALLQAGLPE
jgi:TolB-like protein/Flp pilus assembly protein TadD